MPQTNIPFTPGFIPSLSDPVTNANNTAPTPASLLAGAQVQNLLPGDAASVDFALGSTKVVRAVGLDHGVFAIMASTDPNAPARAAAYHCANQALDSTEITLLRNALGGVAANTCIVVLLLTQAWAAPYDQSNTELQNAGVPANKIAWADNLPFSHFAVNSLGQVGY